MNRCGLKTQILPVFALSDSFSELLAAKHPWFFPAFLPGCSLAKRVDFLRLSEERDAHFEDLRTEIAAAQIKLGRKVFVEIS